MPWPNMTPPSHAKGKGRWVAPPLLTNGNQSLQLTRKFTLHGVIYAWVVRPLDQKPKATGVTGTSELFVFPHQFKFLGKLVDACNSILNAGAELKGYRVVQWSCFAGIGSNKRKGQGWDISSALVTQIQLYQQLVTRLLGWNVQNWGKAQQIWHKSDVDLNWPTWCASATAWSIETHSGRASPRQIICHNL